VEVIAMLFNGQLQKNHRRFIYSWERMNILFHAENKLANSCIACIVSVPACCAWILIFKGTTKCYQQTDEAGKDYVVHLETLFCISKTLRLLERTQLLQLSLVTHNFHAHNSSLVGQKWTRRTQPTTNTKNDATDAIPMYRLRMKAVNISHSWQCDTIQKGTMPTSYKTTRHTVHAHALPSRHSSIVLTLLCQFSLVLNYIGTIIKLWLMTCPKHHGVIWLMIWLYSLAQHTFRVWIIVDTDAPYHPHAGEQY
jgi:hypothetical protein